MDWNGIMNIMLPPRNGIAPHRTSPFGLSKCSNCSLDGAQQHPGAASRKSPGFRCAQSGLLALLILGLAVAPSAAAPKVPAAANNAQQHRGVACPSQNFKVFLEAFSENAKLQRVFIKFPIQIRYVGYNDVENDYEFQTRMIESYDELMPPGKTVWGGPFPNRKERKTERLVMTIERHPASETKRAPDDTIVKVYVPGSDNISLYHFQRTSNCWQLHVIETFSPPT